MNRFLIIPLAFSALALSACGGESASAKKAEAPDPDNVVARVNGEPISGVALDAQLQALASRGQSAGRAQALEQLVDLRLLTQEAESSGLTSQPEIAAELERQRSALLARHVIRAELSDFQPTEDDLRAAYKERVAGMDGKEYKASHILVETEEKAKEMIVQLNEGAEFAKLAEEHSTGPTASRKGDLGWFQADQMVAAFSKAVQELEPGNYTSEPVKTRFGWHVIRLADVREVQKPAFKDIKSDLENELASQHIQDYLSSLRENADVEITDPGLEGAPKSQMPPSANPGGN